MGHVAEDVSRIAHDLVTALSFDVTDKPYTTHAAAQELMVRVGEGLMRLYYRSNRSVYDVWERDRRSIGK